MKKKRRNGGLLFALMFWGSVIGLCAGMENDRMGLVAGSLAVFVCTCLISEVLCPADKEEEEKK